MKAGPAADGQSTGQTPVQLPKPKLCCSARLIFSATCFIALFNVTYVRVGISMALVCMVVPRPHNCSNVTSHEKSRGEFNWSSVVQGYLISGVFYGFIIGPFVAGVLSFKFGGKVILIVGTIATGATNLFFPEAARVSPILFFAVRVVMGFFASFTFPAFYDLVSHWIVPEERQLLVTGALVSIPVASIANFPLSGVICDNWGWIWLFYTIAIWIILWGIIFCFLIFNYPEQCPCISEREALYLKARIPITGKVKVPWKAIFTSLPIYAYIVMHFCISYVYLTMVFSLPVLMSDIHKFSLKENGLLSATPFMGSFVMRTLLSLFFEQLRMKLKLSKNTLRKTFVFLGASMASGLLLTTTFLSSAHRYYILGCFIVASASLELCLSGGYLLSLLDLCPSYVNILTGITNTVANSAGLVGPVVNGLLIGEGSKEQWNSVFYLNMAALTAAATFYLIFGQNQLLSWGLATLPSETPVPRASLVN